MGLKKSTQLRIAEYARRIGAPLVRLIGRSLRLEIKGWYRLRNTIENGTPVVFQFWHGDMFIAWYVTSPLQPAAIVSRAGDGDIASAVLEGLDFVTFRGSSSRGGKAAFLGMIKHLKRQDQKVSAFASDGPRGPRREMKAGTVAAAQKLKGVIVPVATKSKWALQARGWDKFAVPLPFSQAVISFGNPIYVEQLKPTRDSDSVLKTVSEKCRLHQEKLDGFFK